MNSGLTSRLLGPLFITVVAMVALGAQPWNSETVGPLDLLVAGDGWGQLTSSEVRHMARSDVLNWQLPQWRWAREQLERGELPVWNWTRIGGMPALFDLSTAMATPSFALYALVSNEALGLYLAILVRLLAAGLGMYLLLRSELDSLSATLGGVTFMLCGFTTAWLFWPHTSTVMWLPWLIWAVLGFLRATQGLNSRSAILPCWFAIAAASWLITVGGFPAVAAYCFYATGLAFIVWAVVWGFTPGEWVRRGGLTATAMLAGLLMAAPWISGLFDVLSHVDTSERASGASANMLGVLASLLPHHAWTHLNVEQTRYVGTLALIAALIACLAPLAARKTRKPLLWIAIVLFFVSALFVGGWVPKTLVAYAPGLNNSSWARVASVMDFALAALAAIGFGVIRQHFSATTAKRTVAALLIVLAIQATEQIAFFRAFNGPVDAATLYPTTDAISHIKTHQRPLQGTIADFSFWFGGTVNYFGLHEWMSHGFMTSTERTLLNQLGDNLFASPTTLQIDYADFDMNTPLLDALGIRYLLGRVRGESISHERFGIVGHEPAPPLPLARWRQQLTLSEPTMINGVEFHLATYGARQAPGPVQVTLLQNNKKLAKAVLKAELIHDNQWRYFEFDNPTLVSGDVQLELALLNADGSMRAPGQRPELGKLTIWAGKYSGANRLFVDAAPSELALKFHLITDAPRHFHLHRFSRGMGVLENQRVTSNAYWLPDLETPPEAIRYTNQTAATIINNRELEITHRGDVPGWVVVPVRAFPGWTAYLDDVAVETDTYLGALPAFKVAGSSVLSYRYEPRSLYIAFWVAGLTCGACVLVLLGVTALRRSSPRFPAPH